MDWIQKREGVVLFADGLERRFIIFFWNFYDWLGIRPRWFNVIGRMMKMDPSIRVLDHSPSIGMLDHSDGLSIKPSCGFCRCSYSLWSWFSVIANSPRESSELHFRCETSWQTGNWVAISMHWTRPLCTTIGLCSLHQRPNPPWNSVDRGANE